jgi:hypothetical protein
LFESINCLFEPGHTLPNKKKTAPSKRMVMMTLRDLKLVLLPHLTIQIQLNKQ